MLRVEGAKSAARATRTSTIIRLLIFLAKSPFEGRAPVGDFDVMWCGVGVGRPTYFVGLTTSKHTNKSVGDVVHSLQE